MEFSAATIRLGVSDTTIASLYVRYGSQYICEKNDLIKIRKYYSGTVIFCGDYNAQHTMLGTAITDARRSSLLQVILHQHLVALYDGCSTFIRPDVQRSVFDLSLAPQDTDLAWCLEPD